MNEQTGTLTGRSLLSHRGPFKPLLAMILISAIPGFWWAGFNEVSDPRLQCDSCFRPTLPLALRQDEGSRP